MLKQSTYVFIFLILVKTLAFVRELLTAYVYGAGEIADSLILSSIPLALAISLIGTNLGSIIQPTFNMPIETNPEVKLHSKLTLFIGALVGFFIVLVSSFALQQYNVLNELTSEIVYLTSPAVFLGIICQWYVSYRNYNKEFLSTSLSQIPISIMTVFSLIIFSLFENVYLYSLIMVFGYAISYAILQFKVDQNTTSLKEINWNAYWIYFKNVFTRLISVIIIGLVAVSDQTIDRIFAASEGSGVISHLNYAFKLAQLPVYTIGLAISTVFISHFVSINKPNKKWYIAKKMWFIQVLLGLLITIFVVSFSDEIVEIIYLRGEFTHSDLYITSVNLSLYSLGLTGHLFVLTGVKLCIVLDNIKLAMIAGALAFSIKVIFNFIFFDWLGSSGLALATSFAACINAIILLIGLHSLRVRS